MFLKPIDVLYSQFTFHFHGSMITVKAGNPHLSVLQYWMNDAENAHSLSTENFKKGDDSVICRKQKDLLLNLLQHGYASICSFRHS